CRSGKVSSVPSSLHDQLVARSGTIVSRLDCAMCWSYMTRLLKTPIIGCNVAPVDSSRIDMLAGLSRCDSFRIPPAFCASAGPPAAITASHALRTVLIKRFNRIVPLACFVKTDVVSAIAVENASDHQRQPLDVRLQQVAPRE